MRALIAVILFVTSFQTLSDSNLKQITVVGGKYQDSPSTIYLIKLYTEAFRRVGYEFIYKQVPNKRSSVISDKGIKAAGELSRVHHYNNKHVDMIRLDVPHYTVRFLALSTKNPKLVLNGWSSLDDKELAVAYRIGTKIVEEFLPKHVPDSETYGVVKVEQGLDLIAKKRADIYIEGDVNVYKFLNEEKYEQANIYSAGVMEELNIHMFIHKNYKELVPPLNTAMLEMQKEGLFEKYRAEANFAPVSLK